MMPPNSNVRVSILERLVPSLAFAIAAISGGAGSLMLLRFLATLRQSESAGYKAFFGGIAEVELVVGGVLVFAAVLGAIGILVSIIRLFTTNTKASPPGLLFLMTGLLSLVPSFALHFVMHMMKESVRSPAGGGVGETGGAVTAVAWFAMGSAAAIILLLLAFSFIPFSSRPGRKSSPLICLMLVEILFAVLAGIYFWEARRSYVDRDRGFVSATPTSTNTNTSGDSCAWESEPGAVATGFSYVAPTLAGYPVATAPGLTRPPQRRQ